VGPDGRLLDQLLEVLSYFVRCGSVSQRLDLPDEGSDPAHPPGVLTDFLGAPLPGRDGTQHRIPKEEGREGGGIRSAVKREAIVYQGWWGDPSLAPQNGGEGKNVRPPFPLPFHSRRLLHPPQREPQCAVGAVRPAPRPQPARAP